MPKSLFPNAAPETRARLEQDPTVKLFNDFIWDNSPLGPVPDWPASLKGVVRTVMLASTPMVMLVGERGILIYNDAYARFAGNKHPDIFGMPAEEAWPEIAEFNRSNIDRGLSGEAWILQDQELILNRHGHLESGWMDLHYSSIAGDDGLSIGCLCIVHETTDRVLTERALARSEERMALAISGTHLVGTWDWDVVNNIVVSDDRFAALYNIDPLRAGLGLPIDEFLAAIHPDDEKRVGAEIDAALADGTAFLSEYRLIGPQGITWVLASGRPRMGADGRATRFPGVVIDITEQKNGAEALAQSELRFRTLSNAMPQMVWSTTPDGQHDYYNARWYEFTGVPEGSTDGDGWVNLFHPDDRQHAQTLWQHALTTGELYQIEYRLRHHSGQYRWTLGRALPIRDPDGQIVRWIGTCTDIHESKEAAAERELVAQELSHRIKNIFAVLTGIVSLSARNNPEVKPFADELRQRIFALGEAHDFVRPHSHLSAGPEGASALSALIERLMRPYNDSGNQRITFVGDDARVDDAAATPLGLLFHELATNAAKYGALTAAGGSVTIAGRHEGDRYVLTWTESGGPQITPPEKVGGFGSKLVQLSVEGQMRGELDRRWRPEGLEVVISLPEDALSRSARLRSAPMS